MQGYAKTVSASLTELISKVVVRASTKMHDPRPYGRQKQSCATMKGLEPSTFGDIQMEL